MYSIINFTVVYDAVTDELELRQVVVGPSDTGRRVAIDKHCGPRTGGEQFQSGQDANPVRGRAVRRVQNVVRDGIGRGKTASGFDSGHVFVYR